MGFLSTKTVSRSMQMYYRNIDMICEALVNKALFQKLPIQFKDVSNADNIWVKTVCSKYDETCVHEKCNKLGTGIIPNLFPFEHLGEIILVSQWESVTVERSTKDAKIQKDFRITKKATESRTLADAMDIFMKQLQLFSEHNYTNIAQLHKFQCQKNNLNLAEIIVKTSVKIM